MLSMANAAFGSAAVTMPRKAAVASEKLKVLVRLSTAFNVADGFDMLETDVSDASMACWLVCARRSRSAVIVPVGFGELLGRLACSAARALKVSAGSTFGRSA